MTVAVAQKQTTRSLPGQLCKAAFVPSHFFMITNRISSGNEKTLLAFMRLMKVSVCARTHTHMDSGNAASSSCAEGRAGRGEKKEREGDRQGCNFCPRPGEAAVQGPPAVCSIFLIQPADSEEPKSIVRQYVVK